MSKKRRTRVEIMRDVFVIMRKEGGVKKTEIVYGANLNFKRASRMINWLIEKDLVKVESDRYEITEKGEEIFREIDKLGTLFK